MKKTKRKPPNLLPLLFKKAKVKLRKFKLNSSDFSMGIWSRILKEKSTAKKNKLLLEKKSLEEKMMRIEQKQNE